MSQIRHHFFGLFAKIVDRQYSGPTTIAVIRQARLIDKHIDGAIMVMAHILLTLKATANYLDFSTSRSEHNMSKMLTKPQIIATPNLILISRLCLSTVSLECPDAENYACDRHNDKRPTSLVFPDDARHFRCPAIPLIIIENVSPRRPP